MTPATNLSSLGLAFVAGFLAVVIFHQVAALVLGMAGLAPAGMVPWSLDPIAPLRVPAIVSRGFWGGVWAVALWPLMAGRIGVAWWIGWTVLGAIALPLVGIFVVPILKGGVPHDFWTRYPFSGAVNAVWGLGTAALLRFFGR